MGSALRGVAGYLPLTWLTDAVRGPWLGVGRATGSLALVAVTAMVASTVALRRSAL
jgi:ABC-2 type transport system permease protein